MASTVTVSLEPHLAKALKSLLCILPPELYSALTAELDRTEIHYSVLTQISRWARTDAGRTKLRTASLNPRDYDNIVSLLAGTRTSPSSKPPPNAPPGSETTEQRLRRELNDRRALIAVVNGLLSVGCAGAAVWWAADKSGWRDEWKVLFALIVAAIVGASETGLFIIWQSRLSSSPDRGYIRHQRILRPREVTSDKKSDDHGETVEPPASAHAIHLNATNSDHSLRQRTVRTTDE